MEQLIQITNSEDFLNDWAFFVSGLSSVPRTNRLIISLEALYDQFDEQFLQSIKKWQIACEGFSNHRLYIGYLRPFYQIKVLTDHPLLWNYGAETLFSVHGSCEDIPSLMGELFLAHNEMCGNWVDFHKVFGFLPVILETKRKNQLSSPTPLWPRYSKILERYNVGYTINSLQQNRQLSALFFGSPDFPDIYNYGQPFVIAESFSILQSEQY